MNLLSLLFPFITLLICLQASPSSDSEGNISQLRDESALIDYRSIFEKNRILKAYLLNYEQLRYNYNNQAQHTYEQAQYFYKQPQFTSEQNYTRTQYIFEQPRLVHEHNHAQFQHAQAQFELARSTVREIQICFNIEKPRCFNFNEMRRLSDEIDKLENEAGFVILSKKVVRMLS